jgi:preprotein translocase subunit YajC
LGLAFAYQDVPPRHAPSPQQGAPQTSQPPAGSDDPAAAGGEAPGGSFGMLFPVLLLLPLILVLLWSSRSQQKKQQAAISGLKKGDRVVTQSGIVGKLLDLGDRYAKLEVAPGVKIEVLRSGLLGKDTGDAKVEPKK